MAKHIPNPERGEILSFEEACLRSTSDTYDRSRWLYVPDFYTEYRYVLGTRGARSLICAGLNPSTAEPDHLDPTLQSVSRIAAGNGFDSWLMFNVYAQRATSPDDMDRTRDEKLHRENLLAFRALLELSASGGMPPVVWAAWGAVIAKRPWLKDCVADLVRIAEPFDARWVCAGKITAAGHPHHPLYLRRDEPLRPYDVRRYLS